MGLHIACWTSSLALERLTSCRQTMVTMQTDNGDDSLLEMLHLQEVKFALKPKKSEQLLPPRRMRRVSHVKVLQCS